MKTPQTEKSKRVIQFIRRWFHVVNGVKVTGTTYLRDLSKTSFDIGMLPDQFSEEFDIKISDLLYEKLVEDRARVKRYLQLAR